MDEAKTIMKCVTIGAAAGFIISASCSKTYRDFLHQSYVNGDIGCWLFGWAMDPKVFLARCAIGGGIVIGGCVGVVAIVSSDK